MLACRRRLARSPCAVDHHRGKLGEQVTQVPVDKSGSVVGKVNHQIRLPRWRTVLYKIRADTGVKMELPRIPNLAQRARGWSVLLSQDGVRDRSRCLTVEPDKRGAVRCHVMPPGWVQYTTSTQAVSYTHLRAHETDS